MRLPSVATSTSQMQMRRMNVQNEVFSCKQCADIQEMFGFVFVICEHCEEEMKKKMRQEEVVVTNLNCH